MLGDPKFFLCKYSQKTKELHLQNYEGICFDFTILYLAKWLFMQLQNAFYNTSVIS